MDHHKISVRLQSDLKPPYFTGSMLRGAFGYTLKQVTCINPSYQCDGCFAMEKCLYYHFYEKQNLQHSYRFDIELNKKSFDFSLYLFGESCSSLPYVLSSLEKALKQNGIGRDRITFNDFQIDVNGVNVYRDGTFLHQVEISPLTLNVNDHVSNLKIKLLTPLRMKRGNELEYNKISIDQILRSIFQRYMRLYENKEVFSLDYRPEYETCIKLLEYKPLYRKSSRQNRSMVMDGVIGEMAVTGLDKRSYELLKIGEIIGVGKQTVFGMGKIKVEEIDRK